MTKDKEKFAERLPEKQNKPDDRPQRWISVYLSLNVRAHRMKLRGLTAESWHIGRHRPITIVELCLQVIRRILFFAQDTGFIRPGKDWEAVYRGLSEATRSLAQYYADQSNAKEREG